MTRFLDVPALSRLINRVGIAEFLAGTANAIMEDFTRWEQFEKSARLASHSDIGVIELMPVADRQHYGFKYVNGHPCNPSRGLPTVMAFGALADVKTGYPLLLSELTLATAFRTAATSAVAARALARPEAKVLGMVGAGAQSEFQALAFASLLGIEEVRFYDIDPSAMHKMENHLKRVSDLHLIPVQSASEAVRGADIVSTCTADKTWATILTREMIAPGMHINAIGGDCPGKTELDKAIVRDARVFVEYEPQTRVEGEIQQLPTDFPVTELCKVLTGKSAGRTSAEDITLFDSVGFALEDFSIMRFVYELAERLNEGELIELVPDLDDPKDLFERVLSPEGFSVSRKAA